MKNTQTTARTDAMSTAKVGSVVRYSDAGNPGLTYVVVEISDNPWSTYRMRNVETFEMHVSDGRQAGWKVVAA